MPTYEEHKEAVEGMTKRIMESNQRRGKAISSRQAKEIALRAQRINSIKKR